MLLNEPLKPGPFPRPAAEKFKPLTDFMTEAAPPSTPARPAIATAKHATPPDRSYSRGDSPAAKT